MTALLRRAEERRPVPLPERYWSFGDGIWHIVIDPEPFLGMSTLYCGFQPPYLVVKRQARSKVPWLGKVCNPCRTLRDMGKRAKWVPVDEL